MCFDLLDADRPGLDDPGLIIWFTAHVEQHLGKALRAAAHAGLDPEQAVAELVAARGTLLSWVPSEAFRGEGFSNGSWVINAEALIVAMQQRLAALKEQLEGAEYPGLPKDYHWHNKGAIQNGRVIREIKEPSAWQFVGGRKFWPRRRASYQRCRLVCPECGGEFQPRKLQVVRCPGCCAKRRAKRSRATG